VVSIESLLPFASNNIVSKVYAFDDGNRNQVLEADTKITCLCERTSFLLSSGQSDILLAMISDVVAKSGVTSDLDLTRPDRSSSQSLSAAADHWFQGRLCGDKCLKPHLHCIAT
jgi:hypothetical protein